MRKVLITLAIIIAIATVVLFASKELLLNKFKVFLIEKIESLTPRGVKIENIGYVPTKGIRLSGITLYKDRLYNEKEFYISSFDLKFPLVKLLKDKTFSPTVRLYNLNLKNVSVNGSFGFSVGLAKKIGTFEEALDGIESIWFKNLSVKNAFLNTKNLNGSVYVDSKLIRTSRLEFLLNDEPCKMDFEIINLTGELSSNFKISSSRFNIHSSLKKEDEIYKIPAIDGHFLNSSFELMGELENIKNPVLSLYGKVNIDMRDIAYFAPAELKKTLKTLDPEGKINNSVYFKGNLKSVSDYEFGVKSNADYLKIWRFKIDKFYMDARIKDGVLNIPLLSAYPYNGTLTSSMKFDLVDDLIPYRVNCRLSSIDIAALLKNTALGDKNIRGLLFSEFAIRGDGKKLDSMEGSGRIVVSNANLGPMPLLTPLLGNLYGYFRKVFSGLEKIDITKGNCDFYIANRRLTTDNLTLWGDVISIHAKGYVDFDKNLDFYVENQFLEPEQTEEAGWQASLQEMIVRFGKLMSKARLTGTLEKPKWKFEYLGGIKDIFKGGLDKVIKDIFE